MNLTTGRPREQRPGMVYGGRARVRRPAPTLGDRMRAELDYLARCLQEGRPVVTRLPDGPAGLGMVRLTARSQAGLALADDGGGDWAALFHSDLED